MNKIAVNIALNLGYNIISLVAPLLTLPYLARVLGAGGIGIYAYGYNIVAFFVIFVMLGINNYGVREISKNKGNSKKISSIFIELSIIQITLTVVISFLYLIYCYAGNRSVIDFYFVLFIIAAGFDINWFFVGIENFKTGLVRQLFVKVLLICLIFCFIKSESDIIIYIIINGVCVLTGNLLFFIIAIQNIHRTELRLLTLNKHIKPLFILFIPVIVVSIYKISDKILLGMYCSYSEVGLYDYAEKLFSIPGMIITAISAVLLPRAVNILKNNNNNNNFVNYSFGLMLTLCVGMTFGMAILSENVVYLLFGEEFSKSATIFVILAPAIIFQGIGSIIRAEILLPNNLDGRYIASVSIAAVFNVIANCILIPKFGSYGAAVSLLLSEISATVAQVMFTLDYLNIILIFKVFIINMIAGVVMFFLIDIINACGNIEGLTGLIVDVFTGSVIYVLINFILYYFIFSYRK